jgi:hypothetical protein
MALRNLFVWATFRPLVTLFIVWALAVYAYEFKILKRPALSEVGHTVEAQTKFLPFNLSNVNFNCAAQHGFATNVQIAGSDRFSVTDVRCETGFTEATTRCPSLLPMSGFGDQIQCMQPEAIHCHGGPLQSIGLFNEDSFCGDVSDRDLGPPQDAPRAQD